MISFRKCDGSVEVFPYSMLSRIHSSNPDQHFRMTFSVNEVSIEGVNLKQLFHYICQHRATEVVEANRAIVMATEGDCCISRIAFGHSDGSGK